MDLSVGPSGLLDRAAHHRTDDVWLHARWADPRTRVVHATGGGVALTGTAEAPALLVVAPYESDAERVLLGVDPADDVAWFALLGPVPDRLAPPGETDDHRAGLRMAAARLSTEELAVAMHATAMANWHESHPRCSRCGEPTVVEEAGYLRRCPADESTHHPRSDPAVIMLVTDPDDRALLGRHVRWPPALFSTVAGFVEPGESAEDAVLREVLEETGLKVDRASVRHVGSQPWPFPSSLMLGYRAAVAGAQEPVADGVELAEARWFTRDELAGAVQDGSVRLPPATSIARRLIDSWLLSER